jgi:hypothetical protein
MAQRMIYHWKHGWIPLDHYAALSKAHGRESGAKLLMGRLGITGEDGKSRHLEQHLQASHSVDVEAEWKPATPDPHRVGFYAARNAKQTFQSGNKQVVIESDLTPGQTRTLLADVHGAVRRAGDNVKDSPLAFYVPKNDLGRGKDDHDAHAEGNGVITLSPALARGERSESDPLFVGGAANRRQAVLIHEMGHTVDQAGAHTHTPPIEGSRAKPDASAFAQQAGAVSPYAAFNTQEGYAEAFAQWTSGGPGSSPIADAYAKKYGWAPPR